MDAHLSEESRAGGNRRKGKMDKQEKTPVGEVTVSTPRDRDASFDSQFIKKRETMLAEGMAEASAIYHSIIATCKMLGVSFVEYLNEFFSRIIKGDRNCQGLLPRTSSLLLIISKKIANFNSR